MNNPIRLKTVKLLAKLIRPLTEEGLITVPEQNEIISQLKSLASTGSTIPNISPKLIDQRQASEMLGISLANFKKLESVVPLVISKLNKHKNQGLANKAMVQLFAELEKLLNYEATCAFYW